MQTFNNIEEFKIEIIKEKNEIKKGVFKNFEYYQTLDRVSKAFKYVANEAITTVDHVYKVDFVKKGDFTFVVLHANLPSSTKMHRYFKLAFYGDKIVLDSANAIDRKNFKTLEVLEEETKNYLSALLNHINEI